MKQYVYHYHAIWVDGNVEHHNDGLANMLYEVKTSNDYEALKGEIAADMGCYDYKKVIIASVTKLAEYDIDMETE